MLEMSALGVAKSISLNKHLCPEFHRKRATSQTREAQERVVGSHNVITLECATSQHFQVEHTVNDVGRQQSQCEAAVALCLRYAASTARLAGDPKRVRTVHKSTREQRLTNQLHQLQHEHESKPSSLDKTTSWQSAGNLEMEKGVGGGGGGGGRQANGNSSQG